MYRIAIVCIFLAFSVQEYSFAQNETELKVLSLPEVIEIARDQSLMALMSRHQFRSSYWEYRTHLARFRPGLELEATIPSLNNSE